MIRKIFQIASIFILGALGGMVWQAVLLPYLASQPRFEKLWFIKQLREGETIIYPKEEVRIQENVALTEAIGKVENTVIGVKTQTKQGKALEGSGVILTSDGLVVTLAELLPEGSATSFLLNGESLPFEIRKRDSEKNLALVKLQKETLPTCGFGDVGKVKKGQIVFLIGVIFLDGQPQKIVNSGIIKYFEKGLIRTNMFEKDILKGSSLFDIEGNVLGINTIDLEGKVITIPISQIQQFASL